MKQLPDTTSDHAFLQPLHCHLAVKHAPCLLLHRQVVGGSSCLHDAVLQLRYRQLFPVYVTVQGFQHRLRRRGPGLLDPDNFINVILRRAQNLH